MEVRDIPCLFHSFPQQIDSSFHRHHNNNNTNLHYHQSTIQYKQNNNRSFATRTLSASAFLCWRHRVFNFRYATSDNNQSSPPTPPPFYYLFCFSDVYYLPLSSFPTQQIHSLSQQHQTHVLPSVPFPSDNLSLLPILQVFGNGNLQALCAPNLEDGGSVCIGDDINQPSLDADLSSLVTGSFAGFSPCYGRTDPFTNQLNATTVCGVVPDGLFTIAGCPSMACPTPPPPS